MFSLPCLPRDQRKGRDDSLSCRLVVIRPNATVKIKMLALKRNVHFTV